MMQTLHSVLALSKSELPAGLSSRIMTAIESEALHQAAFRAKLASWGVLSSFAIFLVSLAVAGNSFFSSDFWQISSLLFSDLFLVLAHAEVFSLSLAETFPAASAALLIAPLFLSLVALTFRSKYVALTMEHSRFGLAVAR
ncbi:MAG: hypothetical protein WAT81_04880 [Candidatus Moraniibacteriota bacterium]